MNKGDDEFDSIDKYNQECLKNCIQSIFSEEIKLFQPKIIFCFGERTFDELKNSIKNQNCKVVKLLHPAQRTYNDALYAIKQFKSIREGLKEVGIITEDEYLEFVKLEETFLKQNDTVFKIEYTNLIRQQVKEIANELGLIPNYKMDEVCSPILDDFDLWMRLDIPNAPNNYYCVIQLSHKEGYGYGILNDDGWANHKYPEDHRNKMINNLPTSLDCKNGYMNWLICDNFEWGASTNYTNGYQDFWQAVKDGCTAKNMIKERLQKLLEVFRREIINEN